MRTNYVVQINTRERSFTYTAKDAVSQYSAIKMIVEIHDVTDKIESIKCWPIYYEHDCSKVTSSEASGGPLSERRLVGGIINGGPVKILKTLISNTHPELS